MKHITPEQNVAGQNLVKVITDFLNDTISSPDDVLDVDTVVRVLGVVAGAAVIAGAPCSCHTCRLTYLATLNEMYLSAIVAVADLGTDAAPGRLN